MNKIRYRKSLRTGR